jgi:hypothetical protein
MKNTRIDLFLVEANDKDLMAMQSKLNQWWTKNELVKFDIQDIGGKMLFRIVRRKAEGE